MRCACDEAKLQALSFIREFFQDFFLWKTNGRMLGNVDLARPIVEEFCDFACQDLCSEEHDYIFADAHDGFYFGRVDFIFLFSRKNPVLGRETRHGEIESGHVDAHLVAVV